MKLVHLLKGKLVAVAIVSVALVAGATAVFAATPAGQSVVHTITGAAHATATHEADSQDNNSSDNGSHANNSNNNNSDKKNCPGLPDAQQLAAKFSLSTDSTSDDIQAICALHQGTFTGTTPKGTAVSSKRVFGYGEIDMLLTYAQFLATHDTANASGKMASDNARSHLAEAVQSCGTTPLETCLKTNIPGFQPGNGNHGNGDHSGNGNGNGGGKPDSTPTPPTAHH
jgi:hypothetical protein